MRETCNHLLIRSHPGLHTSGGAPAFLNSHDSLAQPTCNDHGVGLDELETVAEPLRLKSGHTVGVCPDCFGDERADREVLRLLCEHWDEHGGHFENREPPDVSDSERFS